MGWIKYIIFIILFVSFFLVVSLVGLRHETNVISTQEVKVASDSVNVGEARVDMEGHMDKETILSNLFLRIADAHKYHDYGTEISYVFLDENDNVTTNEDDIKSVQFEVKVMHRNGGVQSTSRERLEINELLGGDG